MGFRQRLGHIRVPRREHVIERPSRPTADRIHLIAWSLAALFLVLAIVQGYAFHLGHGFDRLQTSGSAAFPLLSAITIFLLTTTVVIVRTERLEPARLVATSVVWSVILLVALIMTWYLVDQEIRETAGVGDAIVSLADVDRYLSAHALDLTPSAIEPIRIPTGIFIESVEFTTANDVQISAFIWQRYGTDVPADVPRGFSLPGAVAESVNSTDAYSVANDDGSTLMGWHVHLTVRQQYDYRNFPLDRQDVWVLIWPEVPDRRVVLVPDFVSYPNIDPASLPGLSRTFVGGGWIAEHTFFSFSMNDDNATFGFPEGSTPRGFPQLVFNLGMKRNFVEPFFDDMLLGIVVSVLLFAIVVLNVQNTDRVARFGITTFGVLATSGTLLFTVLTKHNQIRSEVSPGQLVYMEVIPVILYITILLSVANSILLRAATPGKIKFISYGDNLLPNVVYWPAILGTFLIVTLLVFHS